MIFAYCLICICHATGTWGKFHVWSQIIHGTDILQSFKGVVPFNNIKCNIPIPLLVQNQKNSSGNYFLNASILRPNWKFEGTHLWKRTHLFCCQCFELMLNGHQINTRKLSFKKAVCTQKNLRNHEQVFFAMPTHSCAGKYLKSFNHAFYKEFPKWREGLTLVSLCVRTQHSRLEIFRQIRWNTLLHLCCTSFNSIKIQTKLNVISNSQDSASQLTWDCQATHMHIVCDVSFSKTTNSFSSAGNT